MSVSFGLVDELGSLRRDDEPLGIHLMLRQVLYIHFTEVPDSHVEGDECLVYILENHSVEELAAKVEAGCRSRNRAFMRSKDSLEVLLVFFCHGFLHPVRNRGFAKAEQCLFEVIITAIIKEAQSASP